MTRDRAAGNWLQGFRYYTKEVECPDSFLLWAGIHTISAAIERRLSISWGYNHYYPNLYIMLVAPAGCRKSTAIRFSKKLLQEIGVPTASESLSREALIEQMVTRGRDAQALAVTVGEFAHFLQVSKTDMVTMLTDIYDSEDNWEYTTKKRGVEVIERPYLTLIGGMVPAYIARSFDEGFIEGGFASRTLFVVEERPRFRRARPIVTPDMFAMRNALIQDLDHMTTIEGEYEWTDASDKWFTSWYEEVHSFEEDAQHDDRFKGYMSRKPTHVIRVAQILALAETDELVMHERYFKTALDLITALEPNMTKAFSSAGRNPLATDLEKIGEMILQEGAVLQSTIVKTFSHNLREAEILENIRQLKAMGLVFAQKDSEGNTILRSVSAI